MGTYDENVTWDDPYGAGPSPADAQGWANGDGDLVLVPKDNGASNPEIYPAHDGGGSDCWRTPEEEPDKAPGLGFIESQAAGRDWSKAVLVATTLAAVGGAVGTYLALASINVLSPHPLGDFSTYLTLSVFCGAVILCGTLFSLVWGATRSPKRYAFGALAVAMLATPGLAYVAISQGIVTIQENTAASLVGKPGQGIVKIQQLAEANGIELGWVGKFVDGLAEYTHADR